MTKSVYNDRKVVLTKSMIPQVKNKRVKCLIWSVVVVAYRCKTWTLMGKNPRGRKRISMPNDFMKSSKHRWVSLTCQFDRTPKNKKIAFLNS